MTQHSLSTLRRLAIVIAGGESKRMGTDKASLEFEGHPLLARVVGVACTVCSHVTVVAAKDQRLPALPPQVTVVRDREPSAGPLVAARRGLESAPSEVAFIALLSTDLPLLSAVLLERLFEISTTRAAAIPEQGGLAQPLCAVYQRTAIEQAAERVAQTGKRSLMALIAELNEPLVTAAELLESDELHALDPELLGLCDVDDPEALRRLQAKATNG